MTEQPIQGPPTELRQRLEQQIKRAREATQSAATSLPGAAAQWSPGPRAGSALERIGGWILSIWRRPRMRLAMVGVVLILIGALKVIGSTWTVPVIIVGIVMVVIAWVGSRLEGRFAIEWGENGTQFEMRAQLKPHEPEPAPAFAPLAPADVRGQLDAIEGEAHTVELRVAELKELISAAETAETAANGSTAAGAAEPGPRQDNASAA
ncbi:MAG: hypothetical protein ACR2NR_10385 [Solirubrobacteraceae bacterium]